jgi:hypothetical protein
VCLSQSQAVLGGFTRLFALEQMEFVSFPAIRYTSGDPYSVEVRDAYPTFMLRVPILTGQGNKVHPSLEQALASMATVTDVDSDNFMWLSEEDRQKPLVMRNGGQSVVSVLAAPADQKLDHQALKNALQAANKVVAAGQQRSFCLTRFPPVLVMMLKRYTSGPGMLQPRKVSGRCTFQQTLNLEILARPLGIATQDWRQKRGVALLPTAEYDYTLRAVVVHRGPYADSGHCLSYCRGDDNKW